MEKGCDLKVVYSSCWIRNENRCVGTGAGAVCVAVCVAQKEQYQQAYNSIAIGTDAVTATVVSYCCSSPSL